ncbi:MAG: nucleotide exchange factor GrpE [Candidatus Dadabacteria bacterium]|nr:MAG: nucleotide exchange factor GrpE [Candidatus Dadabacteria bacterium]
MSQEKGNSFNSEEERDVDLSLLKKEDKAEKSKEESSRQAVNKDGDNKENFKDEEENSLLKRINELEKELEKAHNKYLRALADLENYQKRVLKERSELLKYQGEKLIVDLLEVVDDLERALEHKESDPEKIKEGLSLIYKRFTDLLSKWGVVGESAVGKEFDPAKHEAISKVESEEGEGKVVDELKKAYYYKDKLLRPAQVVVAVPGEKETKNTEEKSKKDTEEGEKEES